MENENKILGKKRQGEKIVIEKLINEDQVEDKTKQENLLIKEPQIIKNKSEENIIENNLLNNAQSFGDPKNSSAFMKRVETNIPLTLNKNNSYFTFAGSMSFQNDKDLEQVVHPTPLPNSIPNPQLNNNIIQKNAKSQNSFYSDNSDSISQSQDDSPKNNGQKLKSHYTSSRNTAFGLKEISKRVMEIIKQSGKTTYKAISDQIVNEINEKSSKDEKNIRRRIYDSLNVMKSMKLFQKDKSSKTIMWNYDQEYHGRIALTQRHHLAAENLGKAHRVEFFHHAVAYVEGAHPMKRRGIVLSRPVTAPLFRDDMNDHGTGNLLDAAESLLQLPYVVSAQGPNVLEAQVHEKIVGEQKPLESALEPVDEFSQMAAEIRD